MAKSAAPTPPPEGEIRIANLADALGERYLSYALSTIMARSLPDVRDGLKPVHRRLLYAMRQLKLEPGSGFKKSARVVGDVDGPVSSARRPVDLRRHGAHGAGIRAALSAGRRPGQFRQHRRR